MLDPVLTAPPRDVALCVVGSPAIAAAVLVAGHRLVYCWTRDLRVLFGFEPPARVAVEEYLRARDAIRELSERAAQSGPAVPVAVSHPVVRTGPALVHADPFRG